MEEKKDFTNKLLNDKNENENENSLDEVPHIKEEGKKLLKK